MSVRPSTAPEGKMKSKFITSRTNAAKEMEAWVSGDSSVQREAVRMSGQLTDNVTEERMLKSKLWELSRERYKFLSQSAYERKVFIDRIQRRSSAVRRGLLQQERLASGSPTRKRAKAGNARLAMLDRLDPTKSSHRPKALRTTTEATPENKNVKTVHFGENLFLTSESNSDRRLGRPQIGVVVRDIHTKPKAMQRSLSAIEPRAQSLPRIDGSGLDVRLRDSHRPVHASSWTRRQHSSESTSSCGSAVHPDRRSADPRVTRLQSSLSPVHSATTNVSVSAVVQQITALHLPPKIHKETAKPKMAVKILEHMREKGLIT